MVISVVILVVMVRVVIMVVMVMLVMAVMMKMKAGEREKIAGKFAQTQNIYSDAIGACGDEGHIDDGDGGYWW